MTSTVTYFHNCYRFIFTLKLLLTQIVIPEDQVVVPELERELRRPPLLRGVEAPRVLLVLHHHHLLHLHHVQVVDEAPVEIRLSVHAPGVASR